MKLIDILNNTKWPSIEESLKSHYPETTEDNLSIYLEVYKYLLQLEPIETDFVICLNEEYDADFDDEPYIDVSGKNGKLNKELSDFNNFTIDPESEYANQEVSYSLDLTDWKEWIGMSISEQSLLNFSKNDIIAHCLWEMTFYGYDPITIKNHEKELNRRVEEINNMTEEERKEKLIPWGKVMDEMED